MRGLSLVPLNDLWESSSLFTQVFGYGGNFAFFVPFGVLVYLLSGRIGLTTLYGAGFSLLIVISQYAFQLGFSDIDDFVFSTFGAAAGACIAAWAGTTCEVALDLSDHGTGGGICSPSDTRPTTRRSGACG